ncbi:Hypothetical predicted protein [Mytilus galloprovincialis]|uniref:Uncharacterized protein n=1 Tax=Mytilus galloprovincialis TaxID=29158 RepID=A0A8B6EKM4_MYTGA|nr:Hypothetical predicted protein [Mytilus galloprovincialis]
MATCSNCDREFEKRHDNKGYFRFSLEKPTTSGGVAKEELSALTGVPFTPAKKSRKIIVPEKATRSSKWDSIIGFVRARQYGRAIKGLYESTKGAKRQFMRFVSGVVRKEIKNVLKPKTTFPLCMKADIPSITDFSWTQTLSDFEKSAPLTYNVLRSAITRKSEEATLCKGKTVNLKPKIGTAVAYLLHAKAPIKASFIPTLVSIQFWRGNLKRDTIKHVKNGDLEPNEGGSEESESDITEVEDNDEDSKDDENDDIAEASDNESIHDVSIRSETNPKLQPGFTMCWDNVGKKVTSRHPTLTSTNKYINMALGYMAVNRVTTTNLPWQFRRYSKKSHRIAA